MNKSNWNRRAVLKSLGLAAVGAPLAGKSMASESQGRLISFSHKNDKKLDKPVKVIVIGAGSRGWGAYSSYGLKFPDELQVVGVAEPIPYRRERISKAFNIPEENQFVTWEHVFEVAKFADALFITTPDDLHYGPAMAGLEAGYDLLLEKVIAQSWEQCNDILKLAEKKNSIVAVCHVLRYTPYFRKMKEILDNKEIGDIVSVQHLEPVERIHMSHSFVRGNWGNAEKSNPMILSKSCHDTDILRWLIGKPSQKVSSFGSLTLFRKEMAPEGSTDRCTNNCKIEHECPYSAIKLYKEQRGWLQHLNLEEVNDNTIMRELRNGPYGRCVYHCDNDVVDHQVSIFEFEDGITASFSMEALTHYGGRRTRVFGTKGDIIGDEHTLTVTNEETGKQEIWDADKAQKFASGHGGGDHGLVYDFVRAVAYQNAGILTSTIQASMESHLMGFMAEKSRLQGGQVESIDM
ncbi:Gfo/Idh/MocA family oxidoreductase [Prolixibacteraceae bacterium Z1-6]|uniref:Gfo/Idh/MocA family oxidoreductase n=1 Tax=Draconibacterium aestuarii TaxID=2998507 RepID=A0A9X3J843_9BACT|nr:Gfo/Idh/MocA family oxidoreductase [Prolixibacteraceae bacterium Z1-6]